MPMDTLTRAIDNTETNDFMCVMLYVCMRNAQGCRLLDNS